MKNFYKGRRGLCLPDQNVETLHRVSARRDTTSVRPNPRNHDIPQNRVCDIRRDANVYAPNLRGQTSRSNRDRNRSAPTVTILIIFFVSLFGNLALAQSDRHALDLKNGVTTVPRPQYHSGVLKQNPNVDLETYPMVEYKVDTTKIGYIIIGEKLADEILDMPIKLTSQSEGHYESTLRELSQNKYLVLDFWARGCKPCILSMNKWESLKTDTEGEIDVVGVHLDFDYKALLESEDRGWTMPHIIGEAAFILSRYLCKGTVFGPSVWIRDGTLFGISKYVDNGDFVFDLMEDRIHEIPDHAKW